MSKYRKLVLQFVSEYVTGSGTKLWKAHVPTGDGATFRKQGFTTNASALEWAESMFEKRQVNRGLQISRFSNTTVAEFSERWLKEKIGRKDIRTQTLMRYHDEFRLRIIPLFGRHKLREINKTKFFTFLNDLQKMDLSSTSVNFSAQLLKGIIRQAELEDIIPYTGIQNIPLPKKARPDPIFWSHNQIERFLEATIENPNCLLWKFALYTGMRAGEIAGLKWDCVHFERMHGGHIGFIEVRRSIEQKTQKLVETTKSGDKRLIPILPPVREILKCICNSGEFVFGGMRPLDTSHFARDLQREAKRIGLPKITFHGLRHSFCTWAEAEGINRSITSKIMGHRSQHTTDRYSHSNEETLGKAVGDWLSQQKRNNLRIVTNEL